MTWLEYYFPKSKMILEKEKLMIFSKHQVGGCVGKIVQNNYWQGGSSLHKKEKLFDPNTIN